MSNMSDGKSDGMVLMYCKDGVIYPVALSEESAEMLDLTLGIYLKEIKVINEPVGKIVNLLDKKGGK